MTNEVAQLDNKIKILEAVLVRGDLSQLSDSEKVSHLKTVCESLGLNPLTNPFRYITLNGKLTLYAGRDATDQLRKIYNVSVEIIARENHGDCFVVTARAKMQNGRCDESVGAVYLGKLSGDALANAYMKAETKAKRRVTLSICGLGMLDETEVETIHHETAPPVKTQVPKQSQQNQMKNDFFSPHEIGNRALDQLKLAREAVYQLANKYNITEETMRAMMLNKFKKESSKSLNLAELEQLADILNEDYG